MGPGSALASPRLFGTTLNLLLASTVKHLRHDSGADVKKHPRGTNARVMHQHRPSKFRGHREDRAPLAPMGPVQQKSTGVGPQVQPDTRPFPAQWFTAYRALSSESGLDSLRRRRIIFRQLDPSVGRSGPHAFAV